MKSAASRAARLAGVLLLAGCTVKNPEVPGTNFTISIPIADDRTTIAEVAEERSDYLQIGADGGLALNFATQLGDDTREEVGDRLQITPQSESFSTAIGPIRIPGQTVPPVEIGLGQLLGNDVPAGTVPLIPATDFDTEVEIPLDEIQSLVIDEGQLDLDVDNGMPFDVEDLALELVDRGNGGIVVDRLDLGDIPSGGAASGTFSLEGKDISGDLSLSVSGSTTQEQNAEVSGDESLEFELVLSDLVVSEATAVIPPQSFLDSQVLNFPDDRIQVVGADISEGSLRLRVLNDIPVEIELQLSLDDLRLPDGQVNVFEIERLAPGEERIVDFDLAGNRFAPDNPLQLRLSYAARTFSSGDPVTLTEDGTVEIGAETAPLVFTRVEGVLNRLELPIEAVEDEIDFPEGLDNIQLGSAAMEVHVTSAVGFASDVTLDIVGTNNNGRSGSLQVQEFIARGSPDAPVSFVVTPDAAELTDFLNLLPSSITVTPRVLIGDGRGREVIAQDHWVQVDSVVFRSDARFTITGGTRVEPDPIRREFKDDEARRRISTNLIGADVVTTIENHVPLGVRVRLMVAPDEADVYTNPILTIPKEGFFEVAAAPTDDSGRVTEALSNRQEIAIAKEDILVFLREDGVYTGVLVEFDATDGEVEVVSTDFVNVRASTEILMLLNEDLVE